MLSHCLWSRLVALLWISGYYIGWLAKMDMTEDFWSFSASPSEVYHWYCSQSLWNRGNCVSAFDFSFDWANWVLCKSLSFIALKELKKLMIIQFQFWISGSGANFLKMHHMKKSAVSSLKRGWIGIIKSPNGVCPFAEHEPSTWVSDAGLSGLSSIVFESTTFNRCITNRLYTKEWIVDSCSSYRPIETHGKSTVVPYTAFLALKGSHHTHNLTLPSSISTLSISVPTTQLISHFLVPISYNLSILISPPPSNAHPSISLTTRFPKGTHICQTFYARISHHVACMRSLWKFQLLALTRTWLDSLV